MGSRKPRGNVRRVNRKRLCRICGKPDYCLYTLDEEVSICARVTAGATKVNDRNEGVFVHLLRDLKAQPFAAPKAEPVSPLAPIEVRDAVYRAIIALSPATRYPAHLIDGKGGLAERGFRPEHYPSYGALPPKQRLRDELAVRALRLVKKRYSGFKSFAGIPGFWRDRGGIHLWKPRDYTHPRLLIPYYDEQGRIQALQMRRVHVAEKELRYIWLSSDGEPGGACSGTPLDYSYRPAELPPGAWLVLVEGGLKAQAFVANRPRAFALATSSVNTSHPEILAATHGHNFLLAFDQDYRTNENVYRHLASLLSLRVLEEGTAETTRIAVWEGAKGIDDAVLAGLQIRMATITEWRQALPEVMRELFDQHWREARRARAQAMKAAAAQSSGGAQQKVA